MSEIVLAISRSMRKPSFTERMLDLCLEGMGTGLEVHKSGSRAEIEEIVMKAIVERK